MEIIKLILTTLIFIEVTILLIKNLHKPFINPNAKRKVYIDTSALMDGRILAIAETGFIGDDLIVPRSVIRELQLLADGKDHEKRTRARAGLDNVNDLERIVHFNLEILQDELDRTPVDERLIELAKQNRGLILTVDFNLIKVAQIEGIDTLNVNDLAMVLHNDINPGDKFSLKLTTPGSSPNQAVGHLPNGTMVVVNDAAHKINQTVEVELLRYIQTSAGRMIFATLLSQSNSRKPELRKSELRKSAPRITKSPTSKPTTTKPKIKPKTTKPKITKPKTVTRSSQTTSYRAPSK